MQRKLALITGAAQRVGRALALYLAKLPDDEAFDIAIHYNNSEKEARECCEQIKAANKQCRTMAVRARLEDMDDVAKLIPQVNAELGELSLLINNAAVFHPQNFLDTKPEQLRDDLMVNLQAPFRLAQDFAKQAKSASTTSPGSAMIVNLLDATCERLASDYFLYHLSKQGLKHFTLQAAKSLAPAIRVNGIAPGPALPPPGKDQAHLDKIVKATPLGVASPPESLTEGLGYLLRSPTVTGQILYIDSGMHLQSR